MLLVPALFADSEEPQTAEGYLQQLFFDGPSPAGTLREYYEVASLGGLTATGAVAPWYRTSVTLEAGTGGDTTVFGIGEELGTYLLEAIAAADQVMDLGEFDNDGPDGIPNSGDDSGYVDALAFMFVEPKRSCGGPGVWPHKSWLSGWTNGPPYVSDDLRPDGTPVVADGYVIISASECDGTPLSTVSVMAHELGHELGLPDLYDPKGEGVERILSVNRVWVLGCFDLMAAGSWGCGPADQFPITGPPHLSAFLRDRLGWVNLTTVGSVRYREYVLQPVQTSHQALAVPLDAGGVETLLIEYRPATGFDDDLPASGVLVYRHNLAGSYRPRPPDTPPHRRISMLEADGDSTLWKTHFEGGNRGEAGDVFAADGTVGVINNVTHPSTRLVTGAPTSVTIHSISSDGLTARIVISTAETPAVVAAGGLGTVTALNEVSRDFPVGGGALPYTMTVAPNTKPDGIVLRADGDRLSVEGTVLQTGQFDIDMLIEDARGVVGSTSLPVVVLSPVIADSTLMTGLLGRATSDMSVKQRSLLDNDGNRNGSYDVGDLRRYLLGPNRAVPRASAGR
ncbi:MAG: M6 family metalloprotease domain-containing protein [Gemmatimonadota bacterium]|nr:MAG: M6 family metalloprotease domain-containing protein [Gemmatimonadota bacterium]